MKLSKRADVLHNDASAPDGDMIHVYYGAADTSIALATGSVRALLEWLDQHG